MNKILCLGVILFFNLTFGQNLREELRTVICECFSETESEDNFEIEQFGRCFDFSSGSRKALMEKIILAEIDTTNMTLENGYELGYQFGQNLIEEEQKPLIQNCDVYFGFVQNMKMLMVQNLAEGSKETDIDLLRIDYSNEGWLPDDMWLLGAYELSNGNLEKAKDIFKDCLVKDSTHLASNFLLAVAFDLNKEYDSAVERYTYVTETAGNPIRSSAKMFLGTVLREKEKQ